MPTTIKASVSFIYEGGYLKAYLTLGQVEYGAQIIGEPLLLGTIASGAASRSPAVKETFIELMRTVFCNAAEDIAGRRPTEWVTEHEIGDDEPKQAGAGGE